MKLSIITINFNDHLGLDKTIQSVINQTFRDFEYIVIDGASTDGSVDVIKKYADKLTHWVSEPDTGIYNAMNKGTRMAQGEYCLYLNSGDFLAADDVLEKAFSYDFVEDIVSGNLILFDNKKEFMQKPPLDISLFTFTNGSLPHPSTFIKRDILIKLGGYNESYKLISDWCFFLDSLIAHNCSYRTIDMVISRYNCFGLSVTKGHIEAQASLDYIKEQFPRIYDDYIPYKDESVYNVLLWVQDYKILKSILIFPFKIINRILRLRNRQGKRMRVFDDI